MDFKDTLKQFCDRVVKLKDSIHTEEATKNALIMPFIQMLGYDVFNPLEVVPEYVCDLGTKKGEKIDYAIMRDGQPSILIECKHWRGDLNLYDGQLLRYFHVSKAKFGILTNGLVYRFYTDLETPNKMDEVPFLELDLENPKDVAVEAVKLFAKSYFDAEKILDSASELKYTSEIKQILRREFSTPSPELVRLLVKPVYDKVLTARAIEAFTGIVKASIDAHINDTISDRLGLAMKPQGAAPAAAPEEPAKEEAPAAAQSVKDRIVTTAEELEAFYIVKSILRNEMDPERITYRDSLSYFAIFLDDNNRRPVCRMYLNSPSNKKIAFIGEDRKEVGHRIESLDDIYTHSEQILVSARRFA